MKFRLYHLCHSNGDTVIGDKYSAIEFVRLGSEQLLGLMAAIDNDLQNPKIKIFRKGNFLNSESLISHRVIISDESSSRSHGHAIVTFNQGHKLSFWCYDEHFLDGIRMYQQILNDRPCFDFVKIPPTDEWYLEYHSQNQETKQISDTDMPELETVIEVKPKKRLVRVVKKELPEQSEQSEPSEQPGQPEPSEQHEQLEDHIENKEHTEPEESSDDESENIKKAIKASLDSSDSSADSSSIGLSLPVEKIEDQEIAELLD